MSATENIARVNVARECEWVRTRTAVPVDRL